MSKEMKQKPVLTPKSEMATATNTTEVTLQYGQVLMDVVLPDGNTEEMIVSMRMWEKTYSKMPDKFILKKK